MKTSTLRLTITPVCETDPHKTIYTIAWREEGSWIRQGLETIRAEGPVELLDDGGDEGLRRICAWVADVVFEGRGVGSGLGLALIRMEERSHSPDPKTAGSARAVVEAHNGKSIVWAHEWPHIHSLDSLAEQGELEREGWIIGPRHPVGAVTARP